jgi:hypothetical protein
MSAEPSPFIFFIKALGNQPATFMTESTWRIHILITELKPTNRKQEKNSEKEVESSIWNELSYLQSTFMIEVAI